ncbi:unnamed protein product [Arabidopsis halleri]
MTLEEDEANAQNYLDGLDTILAVNFSQGVNFSSPSEALLARIFAPNPAVPEEDLTPSLNTTKKDWIENPKLMSEALNLDWNVEDKLPTMPWSLLAFPIRRMWKMTMTIYRGRNYRM